MNGVPPSKQSPQGTEDRAGLDALAAVCAYQQAQERAGAQWQGGADTARIDALSIVCEYELAHGTIGVPPQGLASVSAEAARETAGLQPGEDDDAMPIDENELDQEVADESDEELSELSDLSEVSAEELASMQDQSGPSSSGAKVKRACPQCGKMVFNMGEHMAHIIILLETKDKMQ